MAERETAHSPPTSAWGAGGRRAVHLPSGHSGDSSTERGGSFSHRHRVLARPGCEPQRQQEQQQQQQKVGGHRRGLAGDTRYTERRRFLEDTTSDADVGLCCPINHRQERGVDDSAVFREDCLGISGAERAPTARAAGVGSMDGGATAAAPTGLVSHSPGGSASRAAVEAWAAAETWAWTMATVTGAVAGGGGQVKAETMSAGGKKARTPAFQEKWERRGKRFVVADGKDWGENDCYCRCGCCLFWEDSETRGLCRNVAHRRDSVLCRSAALRGGVEAGTCCCAVEEVLWRPPPLEADGGASSSKTVVRMPCGEAPSWTRHKISFLELGVFKVESAAAIVLGRLERGEQTWRTRRLRIGLARLGVRRLTVSWWREVDGKAVKHYERVRMASGFQRMRARTLRGKYLGETAGAAATAATAAALVADTSFHARRMRRAMALLGRNRQACQALRSRDDLSDLHFAEWRVPVTLITWAKRARARSACRKLVRNGDVLATAAWRLRPLSKALARWVSRSLGDGERRRTLLAWRCALSSQKPPPAADSDIRSGSSVGGCDNVDDDPPDVEVQLSQVNELHHELSVSPSLLPLKSPALLAAVGGGEAHENARCVAGELRHGLTLPARGKGGRGLAVSVGRSDAHETMGAHEHAMRSGVVGGVSASDHGGDAVSAPKVVSVPAAVSTGRTLVRGGNLECEDSQGAGHEVVTTKCEPELTHVEETASARGTKGVQQRQTERAEISSDVEYASRLAAGLRMASGGRSSARTTSCEAETSATQGDNVAEDRDFAHTSPEYQRTEPDPSRGTVTWESGKIGLNHQVVLDDTVAVSRGLMTAGVEKRCETRPMSLSPVGGMSQEGETSTSLSSPVSAPRYVSGGSSPEAPATKVIVSHITATPVGIESWGEHIASLSGRRRCVDTLGQSAAATGPEYPRGAPPKTTASSGTGGAKDERASPVARTTLQVEETYESGLNCAPGLAAPSSRPARARGERSHELDTEGEDGALDFPVPLSSSFSSSTSASAGVSQPSRSSQPNSRRLSTGGRVVDGIQTTSRDRQGFPRSSYMVRERKTRDSGCQHASFPSPLSCDLREASASIAPKAAVAGSPSSRERLEAPQRWGRGRRTDSKPSLSGEGERSNGQRDVFLAFPLSETRPSSELSSISWSAQAGEFRTERNGFRPTDDSAASSGGEGEPHTLSTEKESSLAAPPPLIASPKVCEASADVGAAEISRRRSGQRSWRVGQDQLMRAEITTAPLSTLVPNFPSPPLDGSAPSPTADTREERGTARQVEHHNIVLLNAAKEPRRLRPASAESLVPSTSKRGAQARQCSPLSESPSPPRTRRGCTVVVTSSRALSCQEREHGRISRVCKSAPATVEAATRADSAPLWGDGFDRHTTSLPVLFTTVVSGSRGEANSGGGSRKTRSPPAYAGADEGSDCSRFTRDRGNSKRAGVMTTPLRGIASVREGASLASVESTGRSADPVVVPSSFPDGNFLTSSEEASSRGTARNPRKTDRMSGARISTTQKEGAAGDTDLSVAATAGFLRPIGDSLPPAAGIDSRKSRVPERCDGGGGRRRSNGSSYAGTQGPRSSDRVGVAESDGRGRRGSCGSSSGLSSDHRGGKRSDWSNWSTLASVSISSGRSRATLQERVSDASWRRRSLATGIWNWRLRTTSTSARRRRRSDDDLATRASSFAKQAALAKWLDSHTVFLAVRTAAEARQTRLEALSRPGGPSSATFDLAAVARVVLRRWHRRTIAKCLLRHAFRAWSARARESGALDAHHRRTLAKGYLSTWRRAVRNRARAKARDADVALFMLRAAGRRCLRAWRERRQRRAHALRVADQYMARGGAPLAALDRGRRVDVLGATFALRAWRASTLESAASLAARRVVVTRSESRLRASAITAWRAYADERRRWRGLLRLGKAHNARSLGSTGLLRFEERTNTARACRGYLEAGDAHWRRRGAVLITEHLRNFVESRNHVVRRADALRLRVAALAGLCRWLQAARDTRISRSASIKGDKRMRKRMSRAGLYALAGTAARRIAQDRAMQAAQQRLRRRHVAAAVKLWRFWTRRQAAGAELHAAAGALRRGWMASAGLRALDRVARARAARREAGNTAERHLLRKAGLEQWRLATTSRRRERNGKMTATVHWATTLSARVLLSWQVAAVQQWAGSRQEEAAEQYHRLACKKRAMKAWTVIFVRSIERSRRRGARGRI